MYTKIESPYIFLGLEKKIIEKHFKSDDDWEKTVFSTLKNNLIEDLRVKQDNRCCYCRGELGFDIREVEIEHIIPKSLYPFFTLHEKNLALSCPGCNTSKGHEDVLHKPIKLYPRSGRNLKIVHPHFDDYHASIAIHNGAIYEGLNAKGCDTIKLCKLYRLKSVLEKKQSFKSGNTIMQQLVEQLRNATEEQKHDLLQAIQELIR